MNLGDLTIKLSALCALVAWVAAWRWSRGRAASERTFRWAYHGMTVTLAAASGLLMFAILTHDFRFDYVIGYSSRDLPLLYLISAFWAGQQGTYLLWGLFGALAGYALCHKRAWEPAAVMAFYVPTVAFMHLLMLDPQGNPFKLAAAVPLDGRGLNPLLQDPWMASHPPMVFLGYVAMTAPAVLALVALVKRREGEWLAAALRWGLVAFVLLGAGIVLGGFWAYKVLGWGGYWGWDPVENASLVPWLVVTALIHGVLVQRATGALPRTNLVLALAGYALVFYATFLTRSGLLADFSVHSFPAGSIFKILLGIQLLIVAVPLLALLRYRVARGRDVAMGFAWPLVLSAVIVLLVISGGMVLVGTSWPIITSWLGQASSFGPSWYNTVSLPIYIALLGLLSVAPFLGWAVRPPAFLLRRVLPVALVAVAGTAAAWFVGARGAGNLALFLVSLAALAANALRAIEVGRARLLNIGAALAHLGFAMMLVGIVASSAWGEVRKADLPLGSPVEVLGRTLTFDGHVDGSEPRDRWRIRVQEPGAAAVLADVGMFRTGSASDSSVMHQPAIRRKATGDLYIAPAGLAATGGPQQDLELFRGRPTNLGDATLTFKHFETEGMGDGQGMVVWAHVELRRGEASETVALPLTMSGGQASARPVRPTLDTGIDSLTLQSMSVEQGLVVVRAERPAAAATRVLSVEVSTKPLIGLLWLGTLVLGLGCSVAATRRYVDERAMARAREAAARQTVVHRRRKGRRRATARAARA